MMETTQNDERNNVSDWSVTTIKVNIWNKNGTENLKALQAFQKHIKNFLEKSKCKDFILCENLEWFDNYNAPEKKPRLEELFIRGYNYICPRRKLTFEDVEFLMGIDDFREILFYFDQDRKILDYKFTSKYKYYNSFFSYNPIFLYCYNYNEEKEVFYDVQNERLCNDDKYFPSPYKIENHEITFDKNHIEFLPCCLLLIKDKSDIPDICQGETFSDETGPFLITKDTKQYLLDTEGKKIWNITKFDHFEEKLGG